jgi:hypothetical protein
MILLESLVKNNIIREDQVDEILKIADAKYEGNIDEALLDFNLDEDKILEIKVRLFLPIHDRFTKDLILEQEKLQKKKCKKSPITCLMLKIQKKHLTQINF